jgi:hypothetical protein
VPPPVTTATTPRRSNKVFADRDCRTPSAMMGVVQVVVTERTLKESSWKR